MLTKFWQNYFLGKGFAKTSAHLFLNSDVANGKGGGLGRNFPFAPLISFGEFRAGFSAASNWIADEFRFQKLFPVFLLFQMQHLNTVGGQFYETLAYMFRFPWQLLELFGHLLNFPNAQYQPIHPLGLSVVVLFQRTPLASPKSFLHIFSVLKKCFFSDTVHQLKLCDFDDKFFHISIVSCFSLATSSFRKTKAIIRPSTNEPINRRTSSNALRISGSFRSVW